MAGEGEPALDPYAVHEAGQLLVTVHLALAEVALQLPELQQAQVTRIKELLNQVEKHLRRYSHEVRPTILDNLGWIPAIGFLAEGISNAPVCQFTSMPLFPYACLAPVRRHFIASFKRC